MSRGRVRNPYDSLPDICKGLTDEEREQIALMERQQLEGIESIRDGGAALTAYGRLMYSDIRQELRDGLEQSLKEYCELDTLAMVFLYQGLKELVAPSESHEAAASY